MQYVGMPHSWVDFYSQGFEAIKRKYNCNISESSIKKSIEMLKEFNPRISHREVEDSPELIFNRVLEHWQLNVPIQSCIETFWEGLELKAEIYPETMTVLEQLEEKEFVIAALTDLPSAMPDEYFKRDISDILKCFDEYISSAVAGYRKPNCKGLQMIAAKYGVPITELIFVGDEEKDRHTAQNAGCRFIHIDRANRRVGCIHDLYELFKVIS